MNSIAPTNRTALITGAGSGIGKATALAFAKAGINLALVGRSEEKLAAVAVAAEAVGVRAKTYTLDLAIVDRVSSEIATIAADWDDLDILVNNAGMAYTNSIGDTPLADWQSAIDLNLTSVFQCTCATAARGRSLTFHRSLPSKYFLTGVSILLRSSV